MKKDKKSENKKRLSVNELTVNTGKILKDKIKY